MILFTNIIWYLIIYSASKIMLFVNLIFRRELNWIKNNLFVVSLSSEKSWNISINNYLKKRVILFISLFFLLLQLMRYITNNVYNLVSLYILKIDYQDIF